MIRIVLCGFLLIASSITTAFGQAARSPFSAFGIGEYYGNATAHSQGMAGVGISNPQYLYLNNLNPALLVFNGQNGITTFQAGILGERRTVRDETNKETSKAGNLNYMILAFPIKSGKWVTSIGMMPYTAMRYRFAYNEPIPGTTDSVSFQETGTGGINQVAWSNGIALHRYVSVGAKASYLYSTIENNFSNTVNLSQTQLFIPQINQRFYYRGFAFTGALSIHIDSLFNNNYRLNFGAVYDLKTGLNTDYQQTLTRLDPTGLTNGTDTLVTATGTTTIPSILSAGLSFGKGLQWVFAVDARMTDYRKFGFFENQQSATTKGYRVAAGFELTPNPNSLSSYLKVITYRTGVSFEEYPYLINGNALRDFGTNFGLSLPVARGCSVDLAGRWGKRGNIETNTIEETYFKIYFGVTFNDRWFIKRRFD
ncbi:MAG TPA: hypothetical protein VK508_13625 [Cyclobacteriaceae bacterium]|nr:hypothetical protein [Cyclobacteriaceae bacterium]